MGNRDGVTIRHETQYAVNALMQVLSKMSDKGLLKKKLSLWCDNGKHFKNTGVVNFLCSLVGKMFKEISLNFFVPYHGKSICDKHFGTISMKTRVCGKDITTIEDLEEQMRGVTNTTVLRLKLDLVELEQQEQTVERIPAETSVIKIAKQRLSKGNISVNIFKYECSKKGYELKDC